MSAARVTRQEFDQLVGLVESLHDTFQNQRVADRQRIAELEALLEQRIVDPTPWRFSLIRQKDVQSALNSSPNHVRNLIHRGTLTQVKLGGLRFITEESFDSYVGEKS